MRATGPRNLLNGIAAVCTVERHVYCSPKYCIEGKRGMEANVFACFEITSAGAMCKPPGEETEPEDKTVMELSNNAIRMEEWGSEKLRKEMFPGEICDRLQYRVEGRKWGWLFPFAKKVLVLTAVRMYKEEER